MRKTSDSVQEKNQGEQPWFKSKQPKKQINLLYFQIP